MSERAVGDRPKRIQRKRSKGWKMPEGVVCVSRPGPWGNPFVVGVDGTAAECVALYRWLIAGYVCVTKKPTYDELKAVLKHATGHIAELRGKHLACWCRLDKPCHADLLLEIANSPTPPEPAP